MIAALSVGAAFLFLAGCLAFALYDAKARGRDELAAEIAKETVARSKAAAQVLAKRQTTADTVADLAGGRF